VQLSHWTISLLRPIFTLSLKSCVSSLYVILKDGSGKTPSRTPDKGRTCPFWYASNIFYGDLHELISHDVLGYTCLRHWHRISHMLEFTYQEWPGPQTHDSKSYSSKYPDHVSVALLQRLIFQNLSSLFVL
jgi:hypothetical protein